MDKRVVPILFLTFVNMLGFTLLIPVLPYVVEKYNQSPVMYGILLAAYPAFQFLGAPILGSLSDKYGRRPLLLISQLGTLLSWVVFAIAYFIADSYIGAVSIPILVIMFSRIVDGITGGNISVANAYVSDIIEPHDRTKVFGFLGAIIGLALIVGPAIGGVTNSTNIEYLGTVILAIVISTVTLILMYLYLPESLDEEHMDKEVKIHLWNEINILGKLGKLKDPIVSKLFFVRMTYALVFNGYTSIIVLFIKDKFNLSPIELGGLFFLLGFFLVFNQAVAVKQFSDRIGELKTFYVGLFCLAIGIPLLALVQTIPAFFVVAYINNLGISLGLPTFKTLVTKRVARNRQGFINGLDESVLAASSAVAPIIVGLIYAQIGSLVFPLVASLIVISFLVMLVKTGTFFIKIED